MTSVLSENLWRWLKSFPSCQIWGSSYKVLLLHKAPVAPEPVHRELAETATQKKKKKPIPQVSGSDL